MRKIIENRPKLVPLRRFAHKGLYSCAYLSLLVQRKKLKAEKIGRNFYTTEKWFKEYLELHAQNEKWEEYQVYKGQNKEIMEPIGKQTDAETVENKKFKYRTAVLTAAVFVLFIIAGMVFYFMNREQGQVAGVEENATASSTDFLSEQ